MPPTVKSAPARSRPVRTQEQRRAETRAKLLDAAIVSLHECGYAATTTRRVAEISGVSQGAQTHHFPRRVDLVGAAIEELAERRLAALREAAAALPPEPVDRVRAILDLLWTDFTGPVFTVFVKLWVAAAHDAELYERLLPIERRIARFIIDEAKAEDGSLALRVPDAESRLNTVLSTLRGLALSNAFEPRDTRGRDPWPGVRELLERLLLPD